MVQRKKKITVKVGKTDKEIEVRLIRLEGQLVSIREEIAHLQMEVNDRDMEESEEYLDHIFESHVPRGLTRNH